jgi:transposase
MAVCVPGRTDRAPHDRVKTDKRDAIRLARRLAAGELTFVTVPSVEHEQLRDLVRCREDIRADLMRARHRLGKFLLRREIYYDRPGAPWGRKHRIWLASLRFADRASQLTMADYLHAHDVLIARRDRIEAELEQLATASMFAKPIARLRCLRGINTLSALGICAEIGQFERFEHPDSLAAYLGIVPCESTSGERRRQGAITKAGSTHARRLLIEAAYHYQRHPANGEKLQRRQQGQPAHIINIARARPAPAPCPLAPAQARPPQAQRRRRGRDLPRARRVLLGDRAGRLATTQPVAAGEAARCIPALAHISSAFWAMSNRPRRPRSFVDSGRATKQGLGVPSPRI